MFVIRHASFFFFCLCVALFCQTSATSHSLHESEQETTTIPTSTIDKNNNNDEHQWPVNGNQGPRKRYLIRMKKGIFAPSGNLAPSSALFKRAKAPTAAADKSINAPIASASSASPVAVSVKNSKKSVKAPTTVSVKGKGKGAKAGTAPSTAVFVFASTNQKSTKKGN